MPKKSKIEQLANDVDTKMRREAELLIMTGLRELTEDIEELLGSAAIANPTNPLAAIALDKRNSQMLKEIVETATASRTIKGMPNATLGRLREQSRRIRNVHNRYKYHSRKFDRGDLLAMTTAQNILERYEASFRMVELLDNISAEWIKKESGGSSNAGSSNAKKNIRTSIYKYDKKSLERQIRKRRRNTLTATGRQLELNVTKQLRDRVNAWTSGKNTRKSIAGFCSSTCGNLLDIKDKLFNKEEFANVLKTASAMVAENKPPHQIKGYVSAAIKEMIPSDSAAQSASIRTASKMVLNSLYNQNVVLSVKSAIKDDTIKKSAFKNGNVSFVFRAVLDNRTSVVCRFMNGRVIRADNPLLPLLTPPLHPNCRSMLIPNLKGVSKMGVDYGAEELTDKEKAALVSVFKSAGITPSNIPRR